MGKGSVPRPKSVDSEAFGAAWDRIFRKQKQDEKEKPEQLDLEDVVKGATNAKG